MILVIIGDLNSTDYPFSVFATQMDIMILIFKDMWFQSLFNEDKLSFFLDLIKQGLFSG